MAAVTSFIQNITAPLLKNKKSNSTSHKSSRKKPVKYTQRRKPKNSPINKYIEDDNFASDNIETLEVMSTSLSENPFKYNWNISNFSKKVNK